MFILSLRNDLLKMKIYIRKKLRPDLIMFIIKSPALSHRGSALAEGPGEDLNSQLMMNLPE
jgi:hypothetical protein